MRQRFKQRLTRSGFAACALLLLAACTPLVPTGKLALGARFPDRHVLVIPDSTVKIVVRVTGERIPPGTVLSTTLSREQTSTTFEAVPAGLKTVNAKCYDANEAIVAAGETSVTIQPGLTTTARINLEALAEDGGFQLILQ